MKPRITQRLRPVSHDREGDAVGDDLRGAFRMGDDARGEGGYGLSLRGAAEVLDAQTRVADSAIVHSEFEPVGAGHEAIGQCEG